MPQVATTNILKAKVSMPVSLCVLRVEIDEDLPPEMGDNLAEAEAAKERKKKDRGERESKTITVETYASVLVGSGADAALLPSSSRRAAREDADDEDTVVFFCGNPLVQVTKGVLHLYKENELRKEAPDAKTVCLLAVPGTLGARDLLAFVAACQDGLAHVRILRDGSPDHYMALLTFQTTQAAREFHAAFEGVPYTSLEPGAVCRIAWVSRAEWGRDATPPPGHTELPTCPVCLERMDESVAGVLSVQCAHTFHAACLVRWSSARCPVCRCVSTPEPRAAMACVACAAEREEAREKALEEAGEGPPKEGGEEASKGGGEDTTTREDAGVAEPPDHYGDGVVDEVGTKAMWICLICGHVGCGRYQNGHAAKHFQQSNHTYALQLGSNRVWDYAGDNFVHRLMQNKPDGKLVAGEAGPDGGDGGDAPCGGGKMAAMKLEFTYTLTAQLDTQREHYDRQIMMYQAAAKAECAEQRARAEAAEARVGALQQRVDALGSENRTLEHKLQAVTAKLATLQSELAEERSLAGALAAGQAEWQQHARAREQAFTAEVAELKEQLRDVMFFVEARGQLERAEEATAEELAGASVTVAPPAKPRRRRH